jgi:hypothetical protein
MSSLGLVIVIGVTLHIAVCLVLVLGPRRRRRDAGPDEWPLEPWSLPPELTWDHVLDMIEDADPVTRLTLERSFPQPPPRPMIRVAPVWRAVSRPRGAASDGPATGEEVRRRWVWDGAYTDEVAFTRSPLDARWRPAPRRPFPPGSPPA